MLTVKCGSPRTNALVPSSGSTRKKRGPIASGVPNSLACSSEITGTPGKRRARASRISVSPRRSASVTGLWSALALDLQLGAPERQDQTCRRGDDDLGERLRRGLWRCPVPWRASMAHACRFPKRQIRRFSRADEPAAIPPSPTPAHGRPPSPPRSWPRGWPPSSATTSSARPARSSPASTCWTIRAPRTCATTRMELIAASARKLVDHLAFARVAFGAASGVGDVRLRRAGAADAGRLRPRARRPGLGGERALGCPRRPPRPWSTSPSWRPGRCRSAARRASS